MDFGNIFGLKQVDSLADDNFEPQQSSNKYLANEEVALQFIGNVLSYQENGGASKSFVDNFQALLEDRFLEIFSKVEMPDKAKLQRELEILSDKLVEQRKYKVLEQNVVIGLGGRFSAGKSKFINSLLKAEEELLPEGLNPTTSIPTYIVGGPQEEIAAYTNNNKVSLDKEALQALTHAFYKTYKIGFSSFIHSLVITEPDMPYKGLAFLDTPGYNKADNSGDEQLQKGDSDKLKAFKQLQKVDYLIWMVDIENGVISEHDIEFIQQLQIDIPILIVANKADKKPESEIPGIVAKIKESAEEANLNIWGVTAYSSRDHKEWGSNRLIKQFLLEASQEEREASPLLEQIDKMIGQVEYNLRAQKREKVGRSEHIGQVLLNATAIFETRALVDLYGDVLADIREIEKAKSSFAEYKDVLTYYLEQL